MFLWATALGFRLLGLTLPSRPVGVHVGLNAKWMKGRSGGMAEWRNGGMAEWRNGTRLGIHAASSSVWTPRGFVAIRRTMVDGDTGDRSDRVCGHPNGVHTNVDVAWTRGPRTKGQEGVPKPHILPASTCTRTSHGLGPTSPPHSRILEDSHPSTSNGRPPRHGRHQDLHPQPDRGLPPFHIPLASTCTWTPPGLAPPARQGTPTFPRPLGIHMLADANGTCP
jgi:hypothetical protein